MNTVIKTIPELSLAWLETQLIHLNQKAAKLECPCMFITVRRNGIPPLYEHLYNNVTYYSSNAKDQGTPTGVIIPCVEVTIVGDSPKLNGWSFLASLTPTENGNLINEMPFAPKGLDLSRFVPRVNECDHCNTKRQRKEMFLVINTESGEIKMVGRNCMKDFLGHVSADRLAGIAMSIFHFMSEIDTKTDEEFLRRSNPEEFTIDLEEFLAKAHALVQRDGFISRRKADEQCLLPTGDLLWSSYFPNRYPNACDDLEITDKDHEMAKEIITWMEGLGKTEVNSYHLNLQTCAKNRYVTYKSRGYVASAVSSYYANKATKDAAGFSQHVGAVGDRITIEAYVVSVNPVNGYYGTTGIHSFKDKEGNIFTWFASSSTDWFNVGSYVAIIGTVKSHTEFRGIRQTVLSRVKELAPAEAP
jgi:hypothetical protein